VDGAESRRVGARETTAGNFLDFPAIPVLDEGFHFRVRPRTGGEADPGSWSENGPWRGLDRSGVLTESGIVAWNEIASSDRLRLGREILRRTGRDRDPGSAASLAIILTVIEDDEISRRAIEEAVRLAGAEGEPLRSSIDSEVATRKLARSARRDAASAAALQSGRPHLVHDDQRPVRPIDPVLVPNTLRQQRESVEMAIEGLGLSLVSTGWTLSVGHGDLEEISRHGVRMDRFLRSCRIRLGFAADVRPFPGALVLIRPSKFDDCRLIVADLFRRQWSKGDPSMMFPTEAGPWVISPSVDAAGQPASPDIRDIRDVRDVRDFEEARIAGRAIIITAHGGRRLPAWMVEGFAEASAAFLIDPVRVETDLRPAAVASIRAGRNPAWITAVRDDDPAWSPGGAARGLALILVTRLLESGDGVFPGIVAGLKAGEPVDEVFRRWTGLTLQEWFDDSVAWFRFND
jgi:hypothetical protein